MAAPPSRPATRPASRPTDRLAQRPSDDGAGDPPTPATTRERLVEAARRLFHEQGFAGTGVSTILREAGVNSGSLYHFFPTKEALLQAVLESYVELLDPIVMAPQRAAEARDPIERVFTLLEWYKRGLASVNWSLGCPIGNLALEVSDHLPHARELVRRNFSGWCAEVQRWLEEAGDRLPGDIDRARLARFILTTMEGGVMQSRAERSVEPFDACVGQLRDYFDRLVEGAARERGGADRTVRRPGGAPKKNKRS